MICGAEWRPVSVEDRFEDAVEVRGDDRSPCEFRDAKDRASGFCGFSELVPEDLS